jgi:hypothetical protein
VLFVSLALVVGAVIVILVRGTRRQRVWLILSLVAQLLLVAGVVAGMVTARPDELAVASTRWAAWGADRYFQVPAYIILLIFFAAVGALPPVGRMIVAPVVATLIASSVAELGRRLPGPPWEEGARRLEHALAAGSRCTVRIPISPPGWSVELPVADGRIVESDSTTHGLPCPEDIGSTRALSPSAP